MSQFKVGGKVVCVEQRTLTSTTGTVIKVETGEMFTVNGIRECKCGVVALDIGIVRPTKPGHINRSKCKCGKMTDTCTVWVLSKIFIPLDETEFRQVAYTKILDEIPVCAQ